jgi:hypothetical protein
MKKLLFGLLVSILVCGTIIPTADAYDGCALGYTKRATKLFGSGPASCALGACKAQQFTTTKSILCGTPPLQYPCGTEYVYQATMGATTGLSSCASSVTSGPWSAPGCYSGCVLISSDDLTGKCCTCGGDEREFVRSAWSAVTYLCDAQ